MVKVTQPEGSEATEAAFVCGASSHAIATILLVEDEPLLRKAAAEALQSAGYDVMTASNGAEALQLCSERHSQLNLLLSDIVMPGMNGCEVARAIQFLFPKVRILLMSGYARELSCTSAFPAESYLNKPFSTSALLQAVGEILARSASPEISA
jgi:two-component system, cell cycle sensor histidine kinase and response regulator CckA